MASDSVLTRKYSRRTALAASGAAAIAAMTGARAADAATAKPQITVPTSGGATTWLNVRSFGASGNGSSDDTAAINAACDAARALQPTGNKVNVVYLPAGVYRISSTINVTNVFFKGDGQGATRIIATHDWAANGGPNSSWALDQQPSSGPGGGVGLPAPDANHVGSSPIVGTWIEDLWLNGPTDPVMGQLNINLSGIRVGGGAGYSRLRIDGFFAGAFLFSDHEKLLGPGQQGGNYYGVYYGEPSQSSGDQVISDIQLDGAGWASIAIAGSKTLGNVSLRKLHLGQGPFGIYQEETSKGVAMLNAVVLSNVSFENCTNGNIFANGSTGGNATVTNCIFDASGSMNALCAGGLPLSATDRFGRPIGRMVAPIDLGRGQWTYNEVLGVNPAIPEAGVTSYSAMIACGMFIGGRWGQAADSFAKLLEDGGGRVFTTGGNNGDALIMSRSTSCRLLRASGDGMLTGDLVESAGGGQPGCRRSTGSRRPMGVAVHPANNAQSVPIAYSGLASVRCGTNSIQANDVLVADPSQVGCVMAGSYTSSGIVGVAQQASQNGLVSVILQGL